MIISLFLMFFLNIFRIILNIEYDPSGNSNSSHHVGADILKSLWLYDFFIFFHAQYMLRFDRGTYLSLLFKFF